MVTLSQIAKLKIHNPLMKGEIQQNSRIRSHGRDLRDMITQIERFYA